MARKVLATKIHTTLEDFAVTELRLEKPRRGPRPRDLTSIQSVDELPPYLAEVVKAVAAGIQTTREFAERQNILAHP